MRITIFFLLVALLIPAQASAFEVAGWVPWWQDTMGTKSAKNNIRDLDIIYPFAYEVESGGGIVDKADLEDDKWQDLFDRAEDKDVLIIPSVAWFNGADIHEVLSNKTKRSAHIDEIVDMVKEGGYDGVNIDYESKLSKTIDYYSIFLEELKDELGKKKLTCTVEPRTPPEYLYRDIPATIEYANDYKEIAKHCDWVEIMAYDQQRAAHYFNEAGKGYPYIPVADAKWVETVVELALKDIPAEKIMLGVPTYGRQWTLTVAPEWYKSYKSVSSINQPDADELADDYDVEPGRNQAGELSYSFFPEDSPYKIIDILPTPKGTPVGMESAAKALFFATATGMEVPVNIVWYSDAKAIDEKIDLIEKYDLKGVALFKIDGEEDKKIWRLF